VALSSAEAEYVAVVMGIQEGLAVRSLLEELGYEATVTVTTDATAALAACAKRGLLRFKHLAIKWLFVKELVDRGSIVLEKVPTKLNKADFLTKAVPFKTLETNLELLPSLVLPQQSAEMHSLECELDVCTPVVQATTLELARPSGDGDSDHSGLIAFGSLTGGAALLMLIGLWQLRKWCRNWLCCAGRKAPRARDVQTQSQCTYSSTQQAVRASGAQPRFQPLPEAQQGAWPQ
jgi:hypothetical protein